MSLKTRTLKNISIVGVSLVLAVGTTQIALLILANYLTPGDFGMYSAILVVFTIALIVSTLGLDQAAVCSQDDLGIVLGTGATVRVCLTLILILSVIAAAPSISSFFNRPEMTNPLRVASLSLLLISLGFISTVKMTRELRFFELSMSRIAYAVVWPAAALTFTALGAAYWSLVVGLVAGNLAALLVLLYCVPTGTKWGIDVGIVKKLIDFGKYPAATTLVTFMFFNFDKLVIGRYLGADLLGIYFLAFTWGTGAPTILTNIVNNVMFPTYVQIVQDLERLEAVYNKTLTYLGYLSLPISFGLAAISGVFVASFLGPEWEQASVPLALLSFAGLCVSLTSPAGSVFLATGNPNLSWRQTAIIFVPYAILLIPTATFEGLVGVSALMLVATFISLIWVLSMATNLIGGSLRKIASSLWKPFVASAIMALVVSVASTLVSPSILWFLCLIGLEFAVYFGAVYVLTQGSILVEARALLKDLFTAQRR